MLAVIAFHDKVTKIVQTQSSVTSIFRLRHNYKAQYMCHGDDTVQSCIHVIVTSDKNELLRSLTLVYTTVQMQFSFYTFIDFHHGNGLEYSYNSNQHHVKCFKPFRSFKKHFKIPTCNTR